MLRFFMFFCAFCLMVFIAGAPLTHAEDIILPCDQATGAFYLPALSDNLAGVLNGAQNTIITGLPVLDISTSDGAEPGDEKAAAYMRLWEADETGTLCLHTAPVQIRLRGNTSRRFPKKSYRIGVLDEDGKKKNISMCGLRDDDDWILNPMYSDGSKIREALAYELWNSMNSNGINANSSRMAFCELLLNGEYMGLYGIQERIDRKQVNCNKQTGIIYKIDTNHRPSSEMLRECNNPESCEGIELIFSGSAVDHPWNAAAEYIALLEEKPTQGSSSFSRNNTVDYLLWAVMVQACDCHYKNQYIHCVWQETENCYLMYRIPWDTNHTFGDYWDGKSEETNYLSYDLSYFPAVDDLGMLFLDSEEITFCQTLRNRWVQLREGPIQGSILTRRAEELFNSLYPAILRDSEKWPECGMGEGNSANIRDIEAFIWDNIEMMDKWINSIFYRETLQEGN